MNKKSRLVLLEVCILVLGYSIFTGTSLFQDGPDDINEPEANFEYLWKAMDREYALFDEKNVDWKLLYKIYRPKVTPKTTNEELFRIMSQMLGHLNDNHVILRGMGREYNAGILDELKQGDFSIDLVKEKYLKKSRELVHGNLVYGWLTGNIGYFHIEFFEHLSACESAIDRIIGEFKESRGIVIDIRNNKGGDEPVEKAIADRFADKKRLYVQSARRNGPDYDDFEPFKPWFVEPNGPVQFTKPTVLITNRLTMSAAENFALAMKVLPHVTQVGDTTSGVFADAIGKRLPNRWLFGCSFRKFVDRNAFCWEGIGVHADLRIINTKEDIMNKRDRVLEFGVEVIYKKSMKNKKRP
jgi:C-terminal processing protease CtpA/Prc